LLDDAIREHLELRRRHGADPSEVMSKEQEALGSVTAQAGDVRRYLSQETVELDMRAVLGEDASAGVGHAARGGMRSMASAVPVRALR
jgi:hypothetical protein